MTTFTDQSDIALPLIPTEEETAIRVAVHSICSSFGEHYAREKHAAGQPPTELWRALADGGYAGINIPAEWGGGGMGMTGLSIVTEEVTRCGTLPLMLVVSSAVAGSVFALHGTDQQKQHWLRGIATGSLKLAFAITEPDAGTNSHNMRTEIRRDGEGYVVNGQKVWTSGVEDSDAVLLVARFRHDDGTLGKPTMCVVDTDTSGFSRHPIATQYLGPDQQWQLFFDNVRVSADAIVGGVEGGLRTVFDGLNPERIVIAAACNGFGRRAIEKASAYARERVVWDTPIGAHQGVAHPLARGAIQLELARLMTQKAAALFDAGHPSAGDASNMAKFAASDAATYCIDRAVQTHGGNGLTIEYGVSDMWWIVRGLKIGPVSEEMILNHVAQHTLGLPKSY